MESSVTFDTFAAIFKENLTKRSRTAKGISETSVNPAKKPPLKGGEELKKQVEENTEKLIRFVWECGALFEIGEEVSTVWVRWFCERCDRFINLGIKNPSHYEEEISFLRKNAYLLSKITGIPHKINSAYRVWNVSYANIEIPLYELELAMDKFYREIAEMIKHQRRFSQSKILAYADHMMDGVIHPWADGCGRNATVLVMLLSLLPGHTLPVFGSRDEHYASICNLDAHTEYFERCLKREVM